MQDRKTAQVLDRLNSGRFTAPEAALLLGLSVRQVRRKLKAFRDRDYASVPHQNRGRKPPNVLPDTLVARVAELAQSDPYKGCNNHHLQQLLADHEAIAISVSSLRRIRLAANCPSPRKRRAPKHRSKRERKPSPGIMLQIDGSPYQWLGAEHPPCNLLAAIDDATSEVFALFRKQEDTVGYLRLMRQVVRLRGVPYSLYSDRKNIFVPPDKDDLSLEDQLAGKHPDSQFSRAMRQLGVGIIPASSPQAKGRVENLFKTLQDRLTQELHREGITDIDEANRFLPGFLKRHNARFMVAARDPEPAYRPAPDKATCDSILCLQYTRKVRNDHTISFGGQQLSVCKPGKVSYAGKSITVRIALDGQMSFWCHGLRIGNGPKIEGEFAVDPSAIAPRITVLDHDHKPLPASVPKPPRKRCPPPAPVTPADDHPWRRFTYRRNARSRV